MNPIKKLFCGLLAVVLFCTMVTWPAKLVEAAGYTSAYIDYFDEVQSYIRNANEGDTLDLTFNDTSASLRDSIVIDKPIRINLHHSDKGERTRVNANFVRLFMVFSDDVSLYFDGIDFFGNNSRSNGGAIAVRGNNLTIDGGAFHFSQAGDGYGGAIYVNGKNASISNAQFDGPGKTSAERGGAIYIDGSNASIKNCRFNGQSSVKEGGAIYVNKSDALIANCSFDRCKSTENDGGAIFVDSSGTTIRDCSFTNCEALGSRSDGGAIKLTWRAGVGPLRVENCRFKNCRATRYGQWVDSGNRTTIVHCSKPYFAPEYYKCDYEDIVNPGCRPKDLTEVVGVEPTCTAPGWMSYYECWCGILYSGPARLNPRINDLEAWKRGAGLREPWGHSFEFINDGNTITARCRRDPEHKVSLTLAVKDSNYKDRTKNAEITGNTNHEDWKKYGFDYDFYYIDLSNSKILRSEPVDAGHYKAVINIYQGKIGGQIRGALDKEFRIEPTPLNPQFIGLNKYSFRYESGVEHSVSVTVRKSVYFWDVLEEGKDYIIVTDNLQSKTKATEIGTYYAVVRGINNYKGEVAREWHIIPQKPLELAGTLTASPITYGDTLGASQITPCTVKSGDTVVEGNFEWLAPDIKPEVGDGSDSIYTVIFKPNTKDKLDTYGILVADVQVNVTPKDLSGISKENIITPDTYTGDDLKDYIKVDLDGLPGLDLVKGKDYDVIAPTRVVEPGAYTAEIKFKGNYTGSAKKDFTIKRTVGPEDIDLTVPAYTGEVLNDSIIVWLDRKEIKRGTDYDIRFSPAEVKERGKYTAYITLKGDYIKGNVEVIFSVDGEERKPRPAPSPTPTPSPSPSPSPEPSGGGSGYPSGGGSSGGSLSRPPVTTQNSVVNKPNTEEETFEEIDLLELLYAHPDAGKALPLIRMYNPVSGEHIMTTDGNEADTLEAKHGWKREAMTGTSSKANDSPVFRLVHPATGKHIYSMNENEVRVLTTEQGWESDGIVFFAGGSKVNMYRLYNPSLPAAIAHHYTTDEVEYNTLQTQGWTGEGVAFTLD